MTRTTKNLPIIMTRKISEHIVELKTTTKWADAVKRTQRGGIAVEMIHNREEFRVRIDSFKQIRINCLGLGPNDNVRGSEKGKK